MKVPDYQIKNVLKNYSKNLAQKGVFDPKKKEALGINISSDGKRAAIIEKVANNIVSKIVSLVSEEDSDKYDSYKDTVKQKISRIMKEREIFKFVVINQDNTKLTKTMKVENSEFIIKDSQLKFDMVTSIHLSYKQKKEIYDIMFSDIKSEDTSEFIDMIIKQVDSTIESHPSEFSLSEMNGEELLNKSYEIIEAATIKDYCEGTDSLTTYKKGKKL